MTSGSLITFPVPIPKNFSEKEVEDLLQRQGYTRLHSRSKTLIEVVQDRVRIAPEDRARITEALESALKFGQGKVNVYGSGQTRVRPADSGLSRLSALLLRPALRAMRHPLQRADAGDVLVQLAARRVRVLPRLRPRDRRRFRPGRSRRNARPCKGGAVRTWQTASFKECQDDLEKYAKKRRIPMDVPWNELDEKHKAWVLEGEPEWVSWRKSWPGVWYGVRRFFKWLESKAYKMHIRVLLSKYRAYTECLACLGTRLKPEALLWKIEGKSIHDLVLQPISQTREFFRIGIKAPDEATDLLLKEIRTRLRYLCDVGLGYLTLDRQSRTLSGGEVQRINLTTALGTSLVNTLFVLDEPSIGLHPRDMGRVIEVMKRLRDAGNTLVVVEHDPQIMFAADRILDMGPGPGERGGEIVFFGPAEQAERQRRP